MSSDIKIIPLGGVHEDGKNMYLVEVNDLIYILDCGLTYPTDEMLGVDVQIPDFTYLEENADRIAGIFLSHGHADAMGALPYLLKKIDAPVFGSKLTIELAKIECQRLGINKFKNFYEIDETNEIEFDDVTVKFFNTTHTVPGSLGIVLKTDVGNIVYTGHFKFDATVNDNYATDYNKISEIGEEGVLALLSESDQAESSKDNTPEVKIQSAMTKDMAKADGRVIVACVNSNILRIQQILDAAEATDRHVFLTGRELGKIIDAAIRTNNLKLPSSDLIQDLEKIDNYEDNQIVILETGRTGEPLYSLQKMAQGSYGDVSIQQGDLVILATSPTIGMETVIADTKDLIYRAGGRAVEIASQYHCSGHASPKDLQTMIDMLKPRYLIPVSGEYRLMYAHRKLALDAGIPDENIFLLQNGDVLQYDDESMYLASSVQAENVMVDGSGVGDIGNIVLRDRKILSEDGIFVVVLTISRGAGKILSGPKIISRGFVYMKESTDLIDESKEIVTDEANKMLKDKDNFEWSKFKSGIRDALSKFLYRKTERRPMILPIVMEVSSHRRKRNFKKNKAKKAEKE